MENMKVIVRYTDGRMVKGYTVDFFPNRDRFHVYPVDKGDGDTIEIFMNAVKAVFFVRDFVGNSTFDEQKKYVEGETPSGQEVKITFVDGEVMIGSTLGFDESRPGFFLFPADPRSNNIRIYILSSAVKDMHFL
jgi:hypothetical protein